MYDSTLYVSPHFFFSEVPAAVGADGRGDGMTDRVVKG